MKNKTKKEGEEDGGGLFFQKVNALLKMKQQQRSHQRHGNGKKKHHHQKHHKHHHHLIQCYPVHTLKDEQTLLKDIIDVQTSICAANERKRLQDHGAHQQYAKVFEPITKTLLTLDEAQRKRQEHQQNRKRRYEEEEEEEEEQQQNRAVEEEEDGEEEPVQLKVEDEGKLKKEKNMTTPPTAKTKKTPQTAPQIKA